jgi:serine phosphatase RsbU (regulator of sigma subunit)
MSVGPLARRLLPLAACIGVAAACTGASARATPSGVAPLERADAVARDLASSAGEHASTPEATGGIDVGEQLGRATKVVSDPLGGLLSPRPVVPPAPALPSPGTTPVPSAPAAGQPPSTTRSRTERGRRRQARARARSGSRGAQLRTRPRRSTGGRGTGVGSVRPRGQGDATSTFAQSLKDVVEVIPTAIKVAIAALAALALGFGVVSLLAGIRGRRLRRDREKLLQDVGLLQRALLPEVPDHVGGLPVSVAYRPADGPAAGGDFYDVFELGERQLAIIVGDVSGHGRQALARTTLMRYTLRAYLEAGLAPRAVLRLAGRVLDHDLEGEFTTVVVATYDGVEGRLIYACAGHPAPIVAGASRHEPVTASSSPPVGLKLPTGLRQTTVALPAGSLACFYTDGVVDARRNGSPIGHERLEELVAQLRSEASAQVLIDRVAEEADETPDDMAACVIGPLAGSAEGGARVEELEVEPAALEDGSAERFLEACGVAPGEVAASLRATVSSFGGAVLRVRIEDAGRDVEVLPRNVESLASAARGVIALAG